MVTFSRYFDGLLACVTFSPWKRISPPFGVSKRLIHLKSVDFPLPDEPIIHVTSPFFTLKSMSLNTWLLPKVLLRWRTSITVWLSFCAFSFADVSSNLFSKLLLFVDILFTCLCGFFPKDGFRIHVLRADNSVFVFAVHFLFNQT